MRKSARLFAAAGIAAAATISLSGPASATSAAPADKTCITQTNWSTSAGAQCSQDVGKYRVKATYCRVACTTEYGPEVYWPTWSTVTFPTGGTITDVRPEPR